MASRLNPYLTFDGNTREAMEFRGADSVVYSAETSR
jgi:uncharacterized glyoxalase superfamily protein PhnB